METSAKSRALMNGLVAGMLVGIFSLILFFVNPKLVLNNWSGWIWWIIFIGFAAAAVSHFKTKNGGYISFGKAFKESFITLLIATLISWLFGLILYKVIDPNTYNNFLDSQFEKQAEKLAERGLSDSQIDRSMNMGRKFANIFFYLAPVIYLIFNLIPALIIAAVMKNKKPEILEEV